MGSTVSVLVKPVSSPASALANGVGNLVSGVSASDELVEENRRLRQMVATFDLYQQNTHRQQQEIEQLRSLVSLPPVPGKTKIYARIVGYYQLENRITLNVGSASRISPGMPVITGLGLVGTVQTVQASSCQAQLISSPSLKLGAIVLRDPPAAGLMHGEGSTKLVVEFVDPSAPVVVGDLVTTSGFSEHIPRGIPIGRVTQVDDDLEFGSRRAQVFPNVMIGSVREVIVLR